MQETSPNWLFTETSPELLAIKKRKIIPVPPGGTSVTRIEGPIPRQVATTTPRTGPARLHQAQSGRKQLRDQLPNPRPVTQHRAHPLQVQRHQAAPPQSELVPNRLGQRLLLGRRTPESLRVATRQLSQLGFPRFNSEGVRLDVRTYVPELRLIQASCNWNALYQGVDTAAHTALACLTGDRKNILQYPIKRQLAVQALEVHSTHYYQQALLAYTLPEAHPKGFLRSAEEEFSLFDFTTLEKLEYSCPTPYTSSTYIRAVIDRTELQLKRAEDNQLHLSTAEGVSYFEFSQNSQQLVILTAEREKFKLLEFKLKEDLLVPDFAPFGAFPYPQGWPAVLCKSLAGWIASNEFKA